MLQDLGFLPGAYWHSRELLALEKVEPTLLRINGQYQRPEGSREDIMSLPLLGLLGHSNVELPMPLGVQGCYCVGYVGCGMNLLLLLLVRYAHTNTAYS